MTHHSLTLGSLLLTDSTPDATHGYVFNVLASGMSTGSGAPVKEIVTSLLADGDLVRITRYGNREVTFSVEITGPTLGAVAHGEAALRSEIGRRNALTWQPPDALSVPTVFDVVTSEMAQTFDDLDELLGRRRTFVLALTCSPDARSADPVTVEALEAGTTTTTVDACDSTSGWSGSRSGAGSPALGIWTGGVGVVDLDSAVTSPETWTLTRTGSVDLAATPYLVIEARTVSPTEQVVAATGDGVTLPLLSVRSIDSDGWMEFTYLGSSVVSELTFTHTSGVDEVWQGLIVREVTRTDVLPGQTARQLARILAVGGTERTPASIHVQSEDGTDPLTQVIVHTSPEDNSGYSPPLRRWRTADFPSPDTGTDASLYSGEYEGIAVATGGFYAEVPTSALPEGGYTLLARVRLAASPPATVTIFYSTSTIFPDSTTQQGYHNDSEVVTLTDTNWTLVPLATLSLPSVRTKAGKVQIVIQASDDAAQVYLDEAWLFREDDDCALTIVDTERPHLWLDSADVDSAVPTVWVGDGGDTRVHPGTGLLAMGAHVLNPEGTAVFTASLTDNPATDATFYRRWHTNAAS